MQPVTKGIYRLRLADGAEDVIAAQRLRHLAFHGGADTGAEPGLDQDAFDAICTHAMLEDLRSGQLVCCFRMLDLADGRQIGRSYAAQFYDLSALTRFAGPMIEIGRFCIHPDHHDPDILRLAWAGLTCHVDAQGIEMMFGCSSFRGTDQSRYADAFALLKENHLAPRDWLPGIKAPQVYAFGSQVTHAPDKRLALQAMPPLLRTYLMMGGWVSDHAVIDPQMNTLHVFTGLEIRAIPEARKRLLRAVMA
ncbi:ornithine-acyl-ACP acyltransferase [Rhodobacteraceae bacterium EhC02]|jgi:L-ornithine Nalpha-acyltransferase|nr:GNAT family N-acyltransferase [Paracoccaceae bacterium]OAN70567.1 ornithine-acyl-ACP acyltransferase [Rhodobacteraceae bacterium EhC02]